MKKFEVPSIEINEFFTQNIITTSGEFPSEDVKYTGTADDGRVELMQESVYVLTW